MANYKMSQSGNKASLDDSYGAVVVAIFLPAGLESQSHRIFVAEILSSSVLFT